MFFTKLLDYILLYKSIILILLFTILTFFIGIFVYNKYNTIRITVRSDVPDIEVDYDQFLLKKRFKLLNKPNNKEFIVYDNNNNPYKVSAKKIEIVFVENIQPFGSQADSRDKLEITNSYSSIFKQPDTVILEIFINSDYYSLLESDELNNRISSIVDYYLFEISNLPINGPFEIYSNKKNKIFQDSQNKEPYIFINFNE